MPTYVYMLKIDEGDGLGPVRQNEQKWVCVEHSVTEWNRAEQDRVIWRRLNKNLHGTVG